MGQRGVKVAQRRSSVELADQVPLLTALLVVLVVGVLGYLVAALLLPDRF